MKFCFWGFSEVIVLRFYVILVYRVFLFRGRDLLPNYYLIFFYDVGLRVFILVVNGLESA